MTTLPPSFPTLVGLEGAGWGRQGGQTVGIVTRRLEPLVEVAAAGPRRDRGAPWLELHGHVKPGHRSFMAGAPWPS